MVVLYLLNCNGVAPGQSLGPRGSPALEHLLALLGFAERPCLGGRGVLRLEVEGHHYARVQVGMGLAQRLLSAVGGVLYQHPAEAGLGLAETRTVHVMRDDVRGLAQSLRAALDVRGALQQQASGRGPKGRVFLDGRCLRLEGVVEEGLPAATTALFQSVLVVLLLLPLIFLVVLSEGLLGLSLGCAHLFGCLLGLAEAPRLVVVGRGIVIVRG